MFFSKQVFLLVIIMFILFLLFYNCYFIIQCVVVKRIGKDLTFIEVRRGKAVTCRRHIIHTWPPIILLS